MLWLTTQRSASCVTGFAASPRITEKPHLLPTGFGAQKQERRTQSSEQRRAARTAAAQRSQHQVATRGGGHHTDPEIQVVTMRPESW